jgi:septation ring formation regulator EzrA
VTTLEQKEEETIEHQAVQLVETIQQLQQRVTYLELRTLPTTLRDVRNQREATARGAVERIKGLTMECKQLSDRSAQTYEKLTEDPELKA